jgi:hypothetical protein
VARDLELHACSSISAALMTREDLQVKDDVIPKIRVNVMIPGTS